MSFITPRASSSLQTLKPSLRRTFSTSRPAFEAPYYNPWKGKSHLKRPPVVPNPLPRIYPQRVVLSDGSTFTSYTTAPSPAILRLTRDVTNNALWAPGTEKRGVTDEEGRVGRFQRKFDSADFRAPGDEVDQEDTVDDLSWMNEGGKEEAAPAVKVFKKSAGKGKRK